jgi:tetratricopeptide (TPR) repeat protein
LRAIRYLRLRHTNRSTHCQPAHDFSSSCIQPWIPYVSPTQSPNRPDNDTRSPFAVSIANVDRDIIFLENSLSLYPRSHPEHIEGVYNLARLRWARYRQSREKEDLDKSIVHYTAAIFLLPVSRVSDIPRLLFELTNALRERSEKYEQPEGIEYCINYLWYLRRFPIDSFNIPRSALTTLLIRALGNQIERSAGNETRDIKEMVALCRELLTSNVSAQRVFPIAAFISLAEAADVEFMRGRPIELLDEVIECLRDAVKVCAAGSDNFLPLRLVEQLRVRFVTTHSLDDYEEATALLEKILDPSQPGGCPDSICGLASTLATQLAFIRVTLFRNPEYTEVAISRLRAALSSSSIVEGLRFQFTEMLSILVRDRFKDYSLSESLEEANSNISQLVLLSSSQSLAKSGMLFTDPESARKTYSTTAIQQKIQNLGELLL